MSLVSCVLRRASANVHMKLQVPTQAGDNNPCTKAFVQSAEDDPAEIVQDSAWRPRTHTERGQDLHSKVWALADDNQFFGPLLILELRAGPSFET